ncbi:hypothetical protein JL720_2349 [Aureococcus anophagefferens]|nr:hypothetical protein JL720_2349 [Aureococcus anophagefferens]
MRRRCETREAVAWGLAAFCSFYGCDNPPAPTSGGGGRRGGSCWAGPDGYAMCTPSLAIDLVIESGDDGVVLVRRGDNGKYATMGGFVGVGELQRARRRGSSGRRRTSSSSANRSSSASSGTRGATSGGTRCRPSRRADRRRAQGRLDARAVVVVPVGDLDGLDFAFDHRAIIGDYVQWRRRRPRARDDEPFARRPSRATCASRRLDQARRGGRAAADEGQERRGGEENGSSAASPKENATPLVTSTPRSGPVSSRDRRSRHRRVT